MINNPWGRLGGGLTYAYASLLLALFLGLAWQVPLGEWWASPRRAELFGAVGLTLVTSLVSTFLALCVALPAAWRMTRRPLPGQAVIDVLIDLPMSLSPLVLGMAFLLFFTHGPGRFVDQIMSQCGLPLRGAFTGVVLGQTVIAIAFAIRHLRAAFANLPTEGQVEPSLGPTVSRRRSAVCVAATITWARTVGEFGPLLLFVGIVPGQSEVLSTAIYLSWISGDLSGAVVAALLMVALSFGVVLVVRQLADRRPV